MINIYPIVEKSNYILMGQNDPEGRLFLHFQWLGGEFTPAKYKETIEDWASVLEAFRNLGVSEVFSAIPRDQEKTRKWQTMFGLSPVAETEDTVFFRLEV